jgi:hypothetical protein
MEILYLYMKLYLQDLAASCMHKTKRHMNCELLCFVIVAIHAIPSRWNKGNNKEGIRPFLSSLYFISTVRKA